MEPRDTAYDVHVDRVLTGFSVGAFQDASVFISQRFFPRITVNHLSDEYDYYPKGYWNRTYQTKRAEEGVANQIGYGTSRKRYSIGDDALRIYISDKKRANADNPQRLDQEATMLLVNALLIGSEIDFSNTFLQPSTWTVEMQGVAATPAANQFLKWSDVASDPVGDIQTIRRQMQLSGFSVPNAMLISWDVYDSLKSHPDIMERLKYTGTMQNPAQVTKQSMAALFEVDRIEVMQTVINTAPVGIETTTGEPYVQNEFLQSGKVLLAYAPPSVGQMTPVAGGIFVSSRWLPPGADGGPSVRRYRENPAKLGEYIEAQYARDMQVISPDHAALLYDAV